MHPLRPRTIRPGTLITGALIIGPAPARACGKQPPNGRAPDASWVACGDQAGSAHARAGRPYRPPAQDAATARTQCVVTQPDR
jgi:hypothetical protein